MGETIESFLSKLKSEGIDQGKLEAEQLRSKAQRESGQVLSDAKAQAAKIVADANAEAASIMARSRTELELASRDAILKLRESLEKALQTVVSGPIEAQLKDVEFIKELIRSVTARYVEADIHGTGSVKINVTPAMQKQITDWAVNQLRKAVKDGSHGVDLKASLKQAGFEIGFRGGTIEVTQESVVESLMQLVGPGLREILSKPEKRE
ncbi:MAG: hypothetical protein WC749_07395 [Dehalococcoidia bacterium]